MADYRVRSYVNMQDVQPSVTEKLAQLQSTLSAPLNVTSGYRSPAYNSAVGGAKHSQHTHGNAVDIGTKGMTKAEVKALAAEASRLGFNGIGFYDNSLHFDVRATPAAWGPNYRSSSIPGWAKDVATAHLQRAYQGTAPAPAIAAVERQALPAVGPVPEARPQSVATAITTPATKPTAFSPGGVLSPAKVDLSKLSPVSSAQASPAMAAPAPSMAQSPVSAAQSMQAPDVSRFGPVGPAINNATALRDALNAQAANLSPAPAAESRVAQPASMARFSPAAAPQPSSFAPTPASYQTPAFSTAQPKMDAFGQPPMPGVQPATSNPYASYDTLAAAAAAQTAPKQPEAMAPALAAPTRTISAPKVASVPAQIDAPEPQAPAPNTALNSFPDAPKKPGLLSGLLNPTTLASAAIGNMVAGPVGGLLGGLLGQGVKSGGFGGLLGAYNGPTNNIGSGLGAISQVMGGAPAGTTAFSRSMPGMSVTSLPGGGVQRTNQYGVTQITTADGRLAAPSRNNKASNGGGIRSEGARNAIANGIGGLF